VAIEAYRGRAPGRAAGLQIPPGQDTAGVDALEDLAEAGRRLVGIQGDIRRAHAHHRQDCWHEIERASEAHAHRPVRPGPPGPAPGARGGWARRWTAATSAA